MGDAPKKLRTFAERQAFYAEQARVNREAANSEKTKTGVKKRLKLKAGLRRRRAPAPAPIYPCRVYFWQQVEGGPIRIGRAIEGNDQSLKVMRGSRESRAHRLAVILHANTERESVIRQRFAHLKIEPGTSFYHSQAELLEFIATHASEWEPPVKAPIPPKEPAPSREPKRPRVVAQVRACERCSLKFETKDKDRYCKDCRKAIKEEMYQNGYLRALPKPTRVKPENVGASREGDPSPWGENALRSLEGD